MDDTDMYRHRLPPLPQTNSPRELDNLDIGVGSLVLREVVALRNQVSELPRQFRADLREELSKPALEVSSRLAVSSIDRPRHWVSRKSNTTDLELVDEPEAPLATASSWHPGSAVMLDGSKLALPFETRALKKSNKIFEKANQLANKGLGSPGLASSSSFLGLARNSQDLSGPPSREMSSLPSREPSSLSDSKKQIPASRGHFQPDAAQQPEKGAVLFRERGSVIPTPGPLPSPDKDKTSSTGLSPARSIGALRKGNSESWLYLPGEGSCAIAQWGLGPDDDEDDPVHGGSELKRSHSLSLQRTSVKGGKSVRSQAVLKLIGDADTDQDTKNLNTLRNRLRRVVLSPVFDTISASLVILNAVTIGMQTDHMARKNLLVKALGFRIIDTVFCIIFTLELFMRILAFGGAFFYAPDWTWNLFDVLLVGTQIADEIITNIASGAQVDSRVNFSFMRILRILRLIRIMRLIRILRLIGELRTIVSSLLGSMKSLLWTIFLLFLIIYVFAVYLTQLVSDFRVERSHQGAIPNKDDRQMFYLFGSLGRSIFTLYQAISGGIDWNDMAEPLMDRISIALGFVLFVYTAFCLLALMNCVTGVFVEAALEHAKKDRAAYMLRHVRELFESADPEHTGCLDFDRFMTCLDFEPMQNFFKAIDVDISEAQRIFALLDGDDSGSIDLDEFLNGCLGLHGPAQAIHLATLMYETRIAARYSVAYMEYIARLIKKLVESTQENNVVAPVEELDGPVLDEDLRRRKSFMTANMSADNSQNESGMSAVTTDKTSDSTLGMDLAGPILDRSLLRRKSFATSSSADVSIQGSIANSARSAPLGPFSLGRNGRLSAQSDDSNLLECMHESVREYGSENSADSLPFNVRT